MKLREYSRISGNIMFCKKEIPIPRINQSQQKIQEAAVIIYSKKKNLNQNRHRTNNFKNFKRNSSVPLLPQTMKEKSTVT
jgi:hypothetical protein